MTTKPGSMSRSYIVKAIDRAETDFLGLWDVLCAMREMKVVATDIRGFQGRLARTLWRLDSISERIPALRAQLVQKKAQLKPVWFAKRMAQLETYREAIDECAQVGRRLGDSFAWFFTSGSPDNVKQHGKHGVQPQRIPKGIGGAGEVAFIENTPMIGKAFVLYHGITTFLRVGDFSLIDLKDCCVVGIGELKTTHDGTTNTGDIHVYLSGDKQRLPSLVAFNVVDGARRPVTPAMSQSSQNRLRRQMVRMNDVVRARDPHSRRHIRADVALDRFEKVLRGSARRTLSVGLVTRSLVLGCVRLKARSLAGVLLPRRKYVPPKLDRFLEALRPVVDPSLIPLAKDCNSLILGSLKPRAERGFTPLFWWPIPTRLLRPVFFDRAMLTTVFNPAHLVNELRTRGYNVQPGHNMQSFAVSRRTEKAFAQIHNAAWFFRLTPNYLFEESAVANIIDGLDAEGMKYEGKATRVHLDLDMRFAFGPVPRGEPPAADDGAPDGNTVRSS